MENDGDFCRKCDELHQRIFEMQQQIHDLSFRINIADMCHEEGVSQLFEQKRALMKELVVLKESRAKLNNDIATKFEKSVIGNKIPELATLLLKLAISNKDYRNNILGDLEEDFSENAKSHGIRIARLLYWWQTLRSIPWMVIWSCIKRLFKKLT